MKQSLVVLILVAALIALAGCTAVKGQVTNPLPGSRNTSNRSSAGEAVLFENFKMSLRGMRSQNPVIEGVKNQNGGLRLEYYFSSSYWDKTANRPKEKKMSICSLEGDAVFYTEIAKLLGQHQIKKWNGFRGNNPPGILDGESGSFEAVLADGSSISASGSNNFPSGFRGLWRILRERVTTGEITSVNFATDAYFVTLPTAWIGEVISRRGEGLTCFEIPIKGEKQTILIIHEPSYGYYQDSGNKSIKIGVLRPVDQSDREEKEPRFITIRENGAWENYYASLTQAQKAICDKLAEDKSAIAASLKGTNGYTLVPEDGSVLHEADARRLFDKARSLWLSLYLQGEYAGGKKPVTIGGKSYLPLADWGYLNNINSAEALIRYMGHYFAAEYAGQLIHEAVTDRRLVEYNGTLYIADDKIADNALYGGYSLKEIRKAGEGKYVLVVEIWKAAAGDKKYTYSAKEEIFFPVEKNAAGEFVFTAFPYWDTAR